MRSNQLIGKERLMKQRRAWWFCKWVPLKKRGVKAASINRSSTMGTDNSLLYLAKCSTSLTFAGVVSLER